MTDINWGYNCLTEGIHHGRPEATWQLPLLQAIRMFTADELQELVVTRIYNDAMQFVQHGEADRAIPSVKWAERTREYAEQFFRTTMQHQVGEISRYYKSDTWHHDVQDAIARFKMDKLNPNYQPMHGHDSINLLCRILGTRSAREASKDN